MKEYFPNWISKYKASFVYWRISTSANYIFCVIAGCQTEFFICFLFESSYGYQGEGRCQYGADKRHAMVNVHSKFVIKWVDIC